MSRKWLSALLLIALCLSLLTVAISSYIRHAEAGVGCEPWPACYGQYYNNESAQGINVLTEQGERSPYRVARISHRLVTSSLGLILLILFILSLQIKHREKLGIITPSSLLALTVFLALIGPIHPEQPFPLLTFTNFIGGLLMVSMIYYLYRRVKGSKKIKVRTSYTPLIRIGIFLILLQIVWGGWTSANYAVASCDSLFSCNISQQENIDILEIFNPLNSLKLEQQSVVIDPGNMAVTQLLHHILAIGILGYFVFIIVLLMGSEGGFERQLGKNCMFLLSILVLEFLLGLMSLILQSPLILVLTHNLLAALMIIVVASINQKLYTRFSK